MQLTLAEPAVESIDLVLAAWSEAAPAVDEALDGLDATELDALESQLKLRLDQTQIPLWDRRSSAA